MCLWVLRALVVMALPITMPCPSTLARSLVAPVRPSTMPACACAATAGRVIGQRYGGALATSLSRVGLPPEQRRLAAEARLMRMVPHRSGVPRQRHRPFHGGGQPRPTPGDGLFHPRRRPSAPARRGAAPLRRPVPPRRPPRRRAEVERRLRVFIDGQAVLQPLVAAVPVPLLQLRQLLRASTQQRRPPHQLRPDEAGRAWTCAAGPSLASPPRRRRLRPALPPLRRALGAARLLRPRRPRPVQPPREGAAQWLRPEPCPPRHRRRICPLLRLRRTCGHMRGRSLRRPAACRRQRMPLLRLYQRPLCRQKLHRSHPCRQHHARSRPANLLRLTHRRQRPRQRRRRRRSSSSSSRW
mmetsp:Transcript_19754/g.42051  ORF Transcript_19754/g.42051 Transcript_19754/m.42051 type:complete len:355 (-) Transcript_19754:246-1310(-)